MITDDEIQRIRRVAMQGARFRPLPEGESTGVVYFPDGDVAIECEGNLAWAAAELLANAQVWVIDLASEVLDLRRSLSDIADDLHLAECPKVDQEMGYVDPSQACNCHMMMAYGALNPE